MLLSGKTYGFAFRKRGPRYIKSGPSTRAYKAAATGAAVVKLRRDVEKIKRGQLAKEFKLFDSGVDNATATTTGVIQPITLMAQGDTSITREGLEIRLQSISMNCRFTANDSATNGGNQLRVILFMDTECNGDTPDTSDLLDGDRLTAHKEWYENKGRFKILWDKVFVMNQALASAKTCIMKRYYKKFGVMAPKIHFLGGGATTADLGKNHLFIYYLGDEATYGPNVKIESRIRFTDG